MRTSDIERRRSGGGGPPGVGSATNLTLCAYTGTLTGRFGAVPYLPIGYALIYAPGTIALQRVAPGSMIAVR